MRGGAESCAGFRLDCILFRLLNCNSMSGEHVSLFLIYTSSLIDKGNREIMFLCFSSFLCELIWLFSLRFWFFVCIHSVSNHRQRNVVLGDIFSPINLYVARHLVHPFSAIYLSRLLFGFSVVSRVKSLGFAFCCLEGGIAVAFQR